MPKLSVAERDAFLRERGHLARIATLQADGSPSVVPVWFVYEDGKIIITPRKHSAFWANIQQDARVAITIDEKSGLYRKVLVEGKADILYPLGHDDEWRDIYRRITLRYVDEGSGEDEPFSGIWATRFYEQGSKMREQVASGGGEAGGDKLKVG